MDLISFLSSNRVILVSLLVIFYVDVLSAVEWHAKDFPNPLQDEDKCGRKGKKSYVCDPDGVISYKEADAIDEIITRFHNSTGPCICGKKCPSSAADYQGFQPAVALTKKIYVDTKKPRSPTSKEKKKAADKFSDKLRDDFWEFGRCNDDFVIFISTEDRQVYTAVGDKTRQLFLTDSCVTSVFNDNKAHFSGKKWAKGIEEMLVDYIDVYRREHKCNKPVKAGKWTYILLGIFGAGGIGGCCICVFLRQKYGMCKCEGEGGGGGGSAAKYSSPKHHKSHSHNGSRRGSNDSASSGGGGGEF